MEYLKLQWNTPDLICQYLMQLTAKVHNLFAKTPIDASKFKIEYTFEDKTEENDNRELTEAEIAHITMQSKSRWGMFSGLFNWNSRRNKEETKVPK